MIVSGGLCKQQMEVTVVRAMVCAVQDNVEEI